MADFAAAATVTSNEFDFLNELDFVPEDTEELEAMGGRGINAEEVDDSEEEEDGKDDFGDGEEDFDQDEFGGTSTGKDEDY